MKCHQKDDDNTTTHGILTVSRTIRSFWNTKEYEPIVRHILGARHHLSLVLVGDKKMQTLNRVHRNKNTPTNILTFELSNSTAEIYLNIPQIKREAHRFDLTPKEHALFLLIHGCLHLKGYAHGSTMERAEERLLKKFSHR